MERRTRFTILIQAAPAAIRFWKLFLGYRRLLRFRQMEDSRPLAPPSVMLQIGSSTQPLAARFTAFAPTTARTAGHLTSKSIWRARVLVRWFSLTKPECR